MNSITTAWLRFDITVVSQVELPWVARARSQTKPLFDRVGVLESLPATLEPAPSLSADTLLDIVNEFIRVLGLSVAVRGRDDIVVAQTGTNLLRDMLIRVMVLENGPQPQRGVLALKRNLTSEQIAALVDLPPLASTWPSILARTRAIADAFLPRARSLAEAMGAAWPEEFERVTLAYVQVELGLRIDPHAD